MTRTLRTIALAAMIERRLVVALVFIGAPLFAALAAMTPN